jgi:hypothetical protein
VSPPRLVIDCQLYEFTAVKTKASEAGCQLAPPAVARYRCTLQLAGCLGGKGEKEE